MYTLSKLNLRYTHHKSPLDFLKNSMTKCHIFICIQIEQGWQCIDQLLYYNSTLKLFTIHSHLSFHISYFKTSHLFYSIGIIIFYFCCNFHIFLFLPKHDFEIYISKILNSPKFEKKLLNFYNNFLTCNQTIYI
jgi:hypothetical protein